MEGEQLDLPSAERNGSARRRGAVMVIDQAVSTGSNFLVALILAHAFTPSEFGAYSLVYATYLTVLLTSRSFWSETVSIDLGGAEDSRLVVAISGAAGGALVSGISISVALACVSVMSGGLVGEAMLSLAFVLPGLLVQDVWRYGFLASQLPRKTLANDVVWLVLQAAVFAALLLSGTLESVSAGVLAWGIPGVLAAIVGAVQIGAVPSLRGAQSNLRAYWRLGSSLASEQLLISGANVGVFFALASTSALSAVAGLRAAQIVYGPFSVILDAVRSVAVPELVSARRLGSPDLRRWCARLGAFLAVGMAVAGIAASVLPDSAGQQLLGDSWFLAAPLVPILAVQLVARGAITGAIVGLRVLKRGSDLLGARLILAPATIGAAVLGTAVAGAEGGAWALTGSASAAAATYWWRLLRATSGSNQKTIAQL